MNEELLAAYIAVNYSVQDLSYIRLLSSHDYFTNNTHQLDIFLDKSMFSFERALKLEHGIWYSASKFERFKVSDNGAVVTRKDDALSTVARFYADGFYEQHKDLHCYPRLPVAHNFDGSRYQKIYDTFNFERFAKLCSEPEFGAMYHVERECQQFLEFFGKNDPAPAIKLRYAAIASDILLRVRKAPCHEEAANFLPASVCPLATTEELGPAVMGFLPRSVQFPASYPLAAIQKQFEVLKEVYTDLELKGRVIEVKVRPTIFEYLGVPGNNDVLSEEILSTVPAQQNVAVSDSLTSVSDVVAPEQAVETIRGIPAACDHVRAYCGRDLNKLSVEERIVAFYGGKNMKQIWEETLSKAFIKLRWNKVLEASKPYEPGFVIEALAKAIMAEVEVESEDACMLAAGRIVSAKSNWEIGRGAWKKKL